MVRAATTGVIDFSTCDDSERWWRAARLKLRILEVDQVADVARLHAYRWIALQPTQNVSGGLAALQRRAIKSIENVEKLITPWVHQSRSVGHDPRDVMLLWYKEYAPGVLEQAIQQLGIDLGTD